MPIPSQRKYDARHAANIQRYSYQIKAAYRKAINEVAKLSVPLNLKPGSSFYFRNYSKVNDKVNKVLKSLYSEVYNTTVSGINSEWELAVKKNNKLARFLYGKNFKYLPAKYRSDILSNNGAARRAFLYRKEGGLKLSEKVWNNTKQFKKEMELALEVGIGKGQAATTMARNMTQYLNEPNRLYRRVRDTENGVLRLSKAAQTYHPGRGVYRSSYKNALRLTRNETNFSYEASQQEKRKQQDFIVGVRIKVSPQHNPGDDKGGIKCIELQGKYPKDFDWTYKWHVNCRCMSLNIVKSKEEVDKDVDRILNGKEPLKGSKNAVTTLPKKYTNYIENNKDQWKNWSNQPRTFEANSGLKPAPVSKPKIKQKVDNEIVDFAQYEKKYKNYYTHHYVDDELPASKDYKKYPYDKYLEKHPLISRSVKGYKTSDFKFIRQKLTGRIVNNDDYTRYLTTYKDEVNAQIKDITKYINDNKIKQDLKLYRRIDRNDGRKYFLNKKVGQVYTDKSFVSTSLLPQEFFGSFQIEILADAGTKVANLGNLAELEFLIQKGSKFKVLLNDGKRFVVQLL